MENPLEATGIRMVVHVKPNVRVLGRLGVRTMIHVAGITLTQKNGRWVGKVDVVYVQKSTPDGKNTVVGKHEIGLDMPPTAYDKALENGLIVQRDLEMAASTDRLKKQK